MSASASGRSSPHGASARCDACAGAIPATPLAPENRPGLSAIAYRAGRHGDFLASMLAGLSRADRPALAALRTRSTDDFTVALLDAWASALDVLTFYQERIANEAYVRTATERVSLLELARALGYELAPAVAASTFLAFTLETALGAPEVLTVPKGTRVQSVPGQDGLPQTFETSAAIEARGAWNAMRPKRTVAPFLSGATHVEIQGLRGDLRPGDGLLLLGKERQTSASSAKWRFRKLTAVVPDPSRSTTRLSLNAPVSEPEAAFTVHVLRRRAAVFGAHAIDFNMLSKDVKAAYKSAEGSPEWPDFKISKIIDDKTLPLDAAYPNVVAGGWLVLEAPKQSPALHRIESAAIHGVARFGLSGQVTAIPMSVGALAGFDDLLRATSVFCESEEVALALVPDTAPIGGATKKQIVLDGLVADLPRGRLLLVSGKDKEGKTCGETALLDATTHDGVRTTLVLQSGLTHVYQPGETVVFGNVVEATHGETAPGEVLGSGDASLAHQRFSLRQGPLTHVTEQNPRGFASTLEVRVDDVAWEEVPRFRGAGPRDRVFITRIDDQDRTHVVFGDGRNGARLPTGVENLRADYRKGAGAAGNVPADRISLLLRRPPGVRAVTNPIAASGGVDRETLEDARRRAPLSVVTLERIVSLEDYASFARAFHGIAMARATWVWDRDRRGVLLTVAGPGGAAVEKSSKLEKSLREAIAAAADPQVPVHIASFRPATFGVQLKVKVRKEEGFLAARVLDDVRAALTDAFSFERRAFGQNVAKSEIIAAAARVAGVAWLDLDAFFRHDGVKLVGHEGSYLPCRAPRDGDDVHAPGTKAAELLTLALDVAPPSSAVSEP
jgi:hypothetical protein